MELTSLNNSVFNNKKMVKENYVSDVRVMKKIKLCKGDLDTVRVWG